MPEEKSDKLIASEAIYGFCSWLTTCKERTVMGSSSDCAPIAEKIKEFCEVNNFEVPREDWAKNLTFPKHILPEEALTHFDKSSIPGDEENDV